MRVPVWRYRSQVGGTRATMSLLFTHRTCLMPAFCTQRLVPTLGLPKVTTSTWTAAMSDSLQRPARIVAIAPPSE